MEIFVSSEIIAIFFQRCDCYCHFITGKIVFFFFFLCFSSLVLSVNAFRERVCVFSLVKDDSTIFCEEGKKKKRLIGVLLLP